MDSAFSSFIFCCAVTAGSLIVGEPVAYGGAMGSIHEALLAYAPIGCIRNALDTVVNEGPGKWLPPEPHSS